MLLDRYNLIQHIVSDYLRGANPNARIDVDQLVKVYKWADQQVPE